MSELSDDTAAELARLREEYPDEWKDLDALRAENKDLFRQMKIHRIQVAPLSILERRMNEFIAFVLDTPLRQIQFEIVYERAIRDSLAETLNAARRHSGIHVAQPGDVDAYRGNGQ